MSQREEEPLLATAGGRAETPSRAAPPRMRDASSASSLPPPDLGMPASRRTEAPPVSPASSDQGRDGWLSDLLNRADTGSGNQEVPRSRPPQQPPAAGGNPLESLSLDIGRLMDRNLAAEMWDRYQRGESKAFTKRLYTPAGQKAFDEVAPQISRRPQLQADRRPLHHRVRALARRGRARRARTRGAAQPPHLRDRPGLHPARARGRTARIRF